MRTETVLVIEDDPTILLLEQRSLERAGYRVTTATTPADALSQVIAQVPDAIILDYSLAHAMTGLDLYEQFRSRGVDAPVIMVTGYADEAVIIQALRAGVRDFVSKSKRYLDYLPEAVQRVIDQERTRTALVQSQGDLKQSASLLGAALEATADGLLVVDREGTMTRFNARFAEMWKIPAEILQAKDDDQALAFVLGQLKAPDRFLAKVKELYGTPLASSLDILEFTDGRVFERVSRPQILDGEPVGRVWSFRDITKLVDLAYRDSLTGLPNRTLLHERLSQALIQAQRTHRQVALLFIDLDRFKAINDTLGHGAGDALLKAVADRLRGCVRESDTVARLGGDEFTIVLTNLTEAAAAAKVAKKILDALAEPFLLGSELFVTPSIGITVFPDDGDTLDGLLTNADTAMYRAKEQGRNTFQFYTAEMNAEAGERLALETSLRHALERGELLLHYQPQIDLTTGRICGAEALARWRHPDHGLIPPNRFIPLAEETGLIGPIGAWVLKTACEQGQAWRDAGFPPLRIAVNLSGRQFKQADLDTSIRQILKEAGFQPDALALELTESTIMQHASETVATLTRLHAMGISLSIDDFGTGYSSLSHLKQFPIHILKIDTSFVSEVTTDPKSAAIVVSIITLAHSLHLKVMAEGVETCEQLAFLVESGCDEVQGYLFGRPLPAEDFGELLRMGGTVGPAIPRRRYLWPKTR